MSFEIWRDEAENDQAMLSISLQNDKVLRATMPTARLIHSYTAASDFEAFQKNFDWNGWGQWKPVEGMEERFFTDEEVEEQQRYIATRTGL